MRKLFLSGTLVLLVAGCDTKTPQGPTSVTLTSTSTVATSTIPPGATVSFTISPAAAAVGQLIFVNASTAKAAPGRTLVTYSWSFGDDSTDSGMTVSHSYNSPGLYNVTLTLTDDLGQTATASKMVAIGGDAPSTIPPDQSPPVAPTVPPTVPPGPPETLALRFVAPAPLAPDVPADLTLFFQLISSGSPESLGVQRRIAPLADTDSVYSVFGNYTTASGKMGTVDGRFVGTVTPAVSGLFEGKLIANEPECTAERDFEGMLNQFLDWTGGRISGTCSPNPLSVFRSLFLVVTTQPPATSTVSPTTTSVPETTTTTSASSSSTTTTASSSSTTTSTQSTTSTTSSSTSSVSSTTSTSSTTTSTILSPSSTTTSDPITGL